MQQLNKNATKIFDSLLDKLNGQTHKKFTSEGFMPLVVEILEGQIATAYGKGKLISIAHYYKQNGDVMRDPEMLFLVVDLRHELQGKEENLFVFPAMYQQDSLGIYEESIVFDNGAVKNCHKLWQKAHANFANTWLVNIRQQGFLK